MPITSQLVYGYLKGPDRHFIVDPEAAPVVKQIFSLCLAGNGPTKIARMLTEQNISTPGTMEYQRTGSTRRATTRTTPASGRATERCGNHCRSRSLCRAGCSGGLYAGRKDQRFDSGRHPEHGLPDTQVLYDAGCSFRGETAAPFPTEVLTDEEGAPGLTGRYYSGPEPAGEPVMVRCDPRIDFNWIFAKPHPELDAGRFSVVWTSFLTMPESF